MGSEFSNANMTAPGLEDFTYTLVGEENFRGKECYKIESTPVSSNLEDEYGYSRSISWVDKKSYLVLEICYYDFDDELFKTITHKEFKKLENAEGKYMVIHMEAVNHQNKRRSQMLMNKVAVTATNPDYFTVAYLEKE